MSSGAVSDAPVDICVVGGGGHVGAPLAVVLAVRGFRTLIYDVSEAAVTSLRAGRFPFIERGGDALLGEALVSGRLSATTRAADVERAQTVVLTIGTEVDEFQNPEWDAVARCVADLLPYLSRTQLLILRSTVSPGTTDRLQQFLTEQGLDLPVAFCPERVAQGQAIAEIQEVPQLIGGTSPLAESRATAIFSKVANALVPMKPIEAEFGKLFCNAYRYIQFAASNQFYMMATQAGCDYGQIVNGIRGDYDRMGDFPSAGFTAGPCLLKDTRQLTAASNYQFSLGYAAIHANEGLPAFLVNDLARRFPLHEMTIGILGMAFKAGSDDTRSSLSYKLKKLLQLQAAEVVTTDPFVTTDPDLLPLEAVIARSDLLVIAAPHQVYVAMATGDTPVVDIWNLRSSSARAPS